MKHWAMIESGTKHHRHLSRVAHLVHKGADWVTPECGSKPGWAKSHTDEPLCAECLRRATPEQASEGDPAQAVLELVAEAIEDGALEELASAAPGGFCGLQVAPDPDYQPGCTSERCRAERGTFDRLSPLLLTFPSEHERYLVIEAFRESKRARPDRIATLIAEAS